MEKHLATTTNLVKEIQCRLAQGDRHITLTQFQSELREIGYRFDRSMDCYSNAQYMTGPRAGETHPVLSLYPVQIDNGISWANIHARRDDNFKKLIAIRDNAFAVVRGNIAEF